MDWDSSLHKAIFACTIGVKTTQDDRKKVKGKRPDYSNDNKRKHPRPETCNFLDFATSDEDKKLKFTHFQDIDT